MHKLKSQRIAHSSTSATKARDSCLSSSIHSAWEAQAAIRKTDYRILDSTSLPLIRSEDSPTRMSVDVAVAGIEFAAGIGCCP